MAKTFELKIVLFSRNVSSLKTDRILSELRIVFTHDWLNFNWITVTCSVLPFISHDQRLIVGECFRLREISINVNKLLALLYFVIGCLFLNSLLFFYCILLLLVYFFVPLFFYTEVVPILLFIILRTPFPFS